MGHFAWSMDAVDIVMGIGIVVRKRRLDIRVVRIQSASQGFVCGRLRQKKENG